VPKEPLVVDREECANDMPVANRERFANHMPVADREECTDNMRALASTT
jgi:hypothetical protein